MRVSWKFLLTCCEGRQDSSCGPRVVHIWFAPKMHQGFGFKELLYSFLFFNVLREYLDTWMHRLYFQAVPYCQSALSILIVLLLAKQFQILTVIHTYPAYLSLLKWCERMYFADKVSAYRICSSGDGKFLYYTTVSCGFGHCIDTCIYIFYILFYIHTYRIEYPHNERFIEMKNAYM